MSCGSEMIHKNCEVCYRCEENTNSCMKYHCESCGKVLCRRCVQALATLDVADDTTEAVFDTKTCKLCFELGSTSKSSQKHSGKVYPSESPRKSPELPSLNFMGKEFDGHSTHALARITDESFSDHLSPVSVRRSSSRSDEDEGEVSTSHFFDMSSEYFHEISDVDSVCLSARNECNSFMSLESSPSDSPSRIHIISDRVEHSVQREHGVDCSSRDDGSFDQEQAVLEKPAKGTQVEKFQEPLHFETNGLLWNPPPPYDAVDEEESNFTYDDDDDDDEIEEGGTLFPDSDLDSIFLANKRQHVDFKEHLRAAVQGHFRDLVFQLLQGQGIISTKENVVEGWLNIITPIAWQAASFIKPDTSGGGSMDPCNYVKVKCIASGHPSESKLVKGVVCTKNIKHKRMTSQYRNARLLLLGGSLEYQRVPNQLASFNTLLHQENDNLKMIVSNIEAQRPNVLLVEKSVSSFAQEQLLTKDISLVLNVKRSLLERIARCSGATIIPSTDHIPKARLGHCELFHLEKITEDLELVNQFNRKPLKTLMFFEGCPRRLGCTVLLKGSSIEELKKVKKVVLYAVFAAYHLSLETSFLADEGATLPKIGAKSLPCTPEKITLDDEFRDTDFEHGLHKSLSELGEIDNSVVSVPDEFRYRKALPDACDENLAMYVTRDDIRPTCPMGSLSQVESRSGEVSELEVVGKADDMTKYCSANDNSQSILVSFSSHCILNGTVCERSRLLRVKFYGPSDKPLGRYLQEDLFDGSSRCRSCKESTEAHAICYTHQHGNLLINVKRLSSVRLPGVQDGKIWMWHRCLRCPHIEGIPPATPRVVMSDAAWGLSFGKFLELSFSHHASGNRVASCGHSLQRDCLRFYGFGSMVAFFRYSPINILSVRLPPKILEFSGPGEQNWIRKEASELLSMAEALYTEVSAVLHEINHKSLLNEFSDASDLHIHILELNDMLSSEHSYYKDLFCLPHEVTEEQDQAEVDILEINRLRHSLLLGSHSWYRRLHLLDSLLRRSYSPKAPNNDALIGLKDSERYNPGSEDNGLEKPKLEKIQALASSAEELESDPWVQEDSILSPCPRKEREEVLQYKGNTVNSTSLERLPSAASVLSDKIDSAWCGADQTPVKRLLAPTRVWSFDSAQRRQGRTSKIPPSLQLSALRSFHASGDYKYMLRDPVSNAQKTCSQVSPHETEKSNLTTSFPPSFIPFFSLLPEGARLMFPQNGQHDIVLTVYDNEPTSIISYALSSKEYVDWIADKQYGLERGSNASLISSVNSMASDLSTWHSHGSVNLDYMHCSNYSSEDALATDPKSSHFRISFEDESSTASEKMRFSVTCYYAKQFDALRRRCCSNELAFVRSLSRCKKWTAQGGKSNVYFAKSFDERFIIKQVTKTELESFEEFSSEYFKYLADALSSGSPTCLAKILGIYQVTVKPMRGGKETRMDLMVMENLFFGRSISEVYDLKGSTRSRYISDTKGANKVLLDMNLLETLRTNPIFLGSKAKRKLERAVWNDTSFLALVDVMDYSLLVGVDEERKELVLGIIDYVRQYTWDKHLETWVKTSGILGGPKNASPTIISPEQYKKRFRKAMTSYFRTVPDQWSS